LGHDPARPTVKGLAECARGPALPLLRKSRQAASIVNVRFRESQAGANMVQYDASKARVLAFNTPVLAAKKRPTTACASTRVCPGLTGRRGPMPPPMHAANDSPRSSRRMARVPRCLGRWAEATKIAFPYPVLASTRSFRSSPALPLAVDGGLTAM